MANLFDTARFEHMFRIAEAMAAASLIPEHLRGTKKGGVFTPFSNTETKANCFLVVNQSVRWGMDPFAVAPETYVVGGKLAYQGKLIAAVINARAGLAGRLKYSFSGTKGKDDFTITVAGKFHGDDDASEITLSVGDAKTENQMWRKDPEQKLVYSGAVKWARRYCPEVVLGIVTDDDLERIALTEAKPAQAREVSPRPKFEKPEGQPTPEASAPIAKEETAGAAVVETPAPDQPEPEAPADPGIPDPRDEVVAKLAQAGIKEIDFLKHIREKHSMSAGSIRELTTDAAFAILDLWEDITADIMPAQAGDGGIANKEAIGTALRDIGIAQGPFMQGLAKVHPDCSRNWTKVDQMPADVAAWILEAGLDAVISSIRLKGGKL